jgi:hypothetical protein
LAWVVPQRAQRNGKLRFPPTLGDLRPHSPIAVPVHIETSAAASLAGLPFRPDLAVVLNPERVRAEHERILAVIERVEQNADGSSYRPSQRLGDFG